MSDQPDPTEQEQAPESPPAEARRRAPERPTADDYAQAGATEQTWLLLTTIDALKHRNQQLAAENLMLRRQIVESGPEK